MTGIAAPDPTIHVTVLGPSPDLVRVVDIRRTRNDRDLVRVEIGDCDLITDLKTMTMVVERIAFGLVEIEGTRNGGTQP